jgi:hypothetical protein
MGDPMVRDGLLCIVGACRICEVGVLRAARVICEQDWVVVGLWLSVEPDIRLIGRILEHACLIRLIIGRHREDDPRLARHVDRCKEVLFFEA